MRRTIDIDVLVYGGGVAGLWTLARLQREGYSCVLLEAHALGAGQTIASQGIIHGGIKYALTGEAGAASKAIAAMPEVWRQCLAGAGELDLLRVRVLSEKQHLWTTPGIGSRIAGVAASKVIRTAVRSVPRDSRDAPFDRAPRGVDVYEVEEPVLDPRSVVSALAECAGAPILVTDLGAHGLGSRGVGLLIENGQVRDRVEFHAKRCVLAAGAGNAGLVSAFGYTSIGDEPPYARPQKRPLHMIMVRGNLPMIYGHCVGMSDKPRVTITSQSDPQGRTVWYVGGTIAETGVGHAREAQIHAAQRAIAECVPWVSLEGTQWSSLMIDRAEGTFGDSGDQRPDGPFVFATDDIILTWPTKLAFAPLLAERVLECLRNQDVRPTPVDLSDLASWPRPAIAALPWEKEGVEWT